MAVATALPPGRTRRPADRTVRAVTAADGLEAGLRCLGIGSGELGTPTVRVGLDPLGLRPEPERDSTGRRPGFDGLPPRTLLWLRLGASEHLLGTTVEHLRGRQVGDGLLLHNPVVRTQLALAVTEQLVVEAELLEQVGQAGQVGQPGPATGARLHRTLTDTDRLLLRLLGARSFLDDGPGTAALVSECLPGLALEARDG